jgi:hypothetical protein
MKKVKNIPHPELKSARQLKPLELNAFQIEKRHTILTPEQLERLAKDSKK